MQSRYGVDFWGEQLALVVDMLKKERQWAVGGSGMSENRETALANMFMFFAHPMLKRLAQVDLELPSDDPVILEIPNAFGKSWDNAEARRVIVEMEIVKATPGYGSRRLLQQRYRELARELSEIEARERGSMPVQLTPSSAEQRAQAARERLQQVENWTGADVRRHYNTAYFSEHGYVRGKEDSTVVVDRLTSAQAENNMTVEVSLAALKQRGIERSDVTNGEFAARQGMRYYLETGIIKQREIDRLQSIIRQSDAERTTAENAREENKRINALAKALSATGYNAAARTVENVAWDSGVLQAIHTDITTVLEQLLKDGFNVEHMQIKDDTGSSDRLFTLVLVDSSGVERRINMNDRGVRDRAYINNNLKFYLDSQQKTGL
jgi:hypothetical protein